jgi:hypothetical protein
MKNRVQIRKNASGNFDSPLTQYSQLQTRSFAIQAKNQQDIENESLNQDKLEATKLEIQAKHGAITPEGQERLIQLQTKIGNFWQQKRESIQRSSRNLLAINNLSVPRERREPIQPKLSIGQPGDKYEKEADRVASQVVSQINAPVPQQSAQSQSVQREAIPEDEDELMMKPHSRSIQREEMLNEEDELQMKPMVQLQASGGGMTATPDLETAIQQERGSGQPLANTIREPMERAFGADFSGVKVHTNARSNQLNQSIRARAFTTGQDIFFRQGEYNPVDRGGQELIAHELTHVIQQKGLVGQPQIQRFYQVGNLRISDGYQIVLEDRKTAYASERKFLTANQSLDTRQSTIMLEPGQTKDYGGQHPFHKVEVRYRRDKVDDEIARLNPVGGDSQEDISQKHQAYMREIRTVEEDLLKFILEDIDTQLLGSKEWKQANNAKRSNLMLNKIHEWCWAGQRDLTNQRSSKPKRFDLLFLELQKAAEPILDFEDDQKQKDQLLNKLSQLHTKIKIFIDIEDQYEGAITLPNDCGQCVSEVVGGEQARKRDNDNPGVGQNYFTNLPQPQTSQIGWGFHWAGIVMEDGKDKLSLESAGDPSLSVPRDKQTWWFEMYGNKGDAQTFKQQIEKKHYERNLRLLGEHQANLSEKLGQPGNLQDAKKAEKISTEFKIAGDDISNIEQELRILNS